MDRRRIMTHICMWSLILPGVFLAFALIPPQAVISGRPAEYLNAIAVFLGAVMVYHIVTSIMLRFNLPYSLRRERNLVKSGVYGKFAHPTCTTVVILFWILFFLFPQLRLMVAGIWLTAVVVFWIKVEEGFFLGKKSGPYTEPGP